MKKHKFASLRDIYQRTEIVPSSSYTIPKESGNVEEETLSTYVLDLHCPTLSPPQVKEEVPSHHSGDVSSSSQSESEMSDIDAVLSPNTEIEIPSLYESSYDPLGSNPERSKLPSLL